MQVNITLSKLGLVKQAQISFLMRLQVWLIKMTVIDFSKAFVLVILGILIKN